MKFVLSIFFLLLLNDSFSQNNSRVYPSYDEVVEKFFKTYSGKGYVTPHQIKFEKRPSGWHVGVYKRSYVQETIINEIFWDRTDNKYQALGFEVLSKEENNQAKIDQYKADWQKRYYSFIPYYGYPMWEKDVIQEYQDRSSLSDSTTYALGRAYSSYANSLLNYKPNYDFQFDLKEGRNCMSEEQLKTYRHYRHLAIQKFEEVFSINPDFETIVGAIQIKADNECLSGFLDLRIYQNEEEAEKELRDGLYSPFIIANSKNLLKSCAPNAILFTNGDNDTFPLLYVQSSYKFRQDVLVINLSLLNDSRYIDHFRDSILASPPLALRLTPAEIKGTKKEVVLIENSSSRYSLSSVIDFVKDETNTKLNGGIEYSYLPSSQFSLETKTETLDFEIDSYYIRKNQLIVFDLLSNYNWERPLYFATTVTPNWHFGLTPFFQLEGLLNRLLPKVNNEPGQLIPTVGTSLMYTNLMEKYEFVGLDSLIYTEKLFSLNYRTSFHNLARAFIENGEKDSAELVLQKCLETFPNKILYFDEFMLNIVEDFYLLGDFETANAIAFQIIENEELGRRNSIGITWVDFGSSNTLANLERLAQIYEQTEIIRRLKK